MKRSVELSNHYKLKIRSFFNRELSNFDIDKRIDQHALMQAITSYETFLGHCISTFGWDIFYSPVKVDIVKSSANKSSKNLSISLDCVNMMYAIVIARKSLKRSSSDRFSVWIYVNGRHRIQYPIIKYATKAKKTTTKKEFTIYQIEDHFKKDFVEKDPASKKLDVSENCSVKDSYEKSSSEEEEDISN